MHRLTGQGFLFGIRFTYINGHLNAVTYFAIHLHHQGDLFILGCGFIHFGPGLSVDGIGFPHFLPHFFSHVRGDGRQHLNIDLAHFVPGRTAVSIGFQLGHLVHQLHQAGNDGVELELLKVIGNHFQSLVHFAAQHLDSIFLDCDGFQRFQNGSPHTA
ncbi:hypothetical protein SDC9_196868 [bioreactor metagenome]|uniref:NAD-specific glutamate dehydrogenase n=1 Tax=bioreactor metagenome TaxID=1076179 RepID=A0A645IPT1_9ZZZZ